MLKIKKEKIVYSRLPEDGYGYTEKMNKSYDFMSFFYDAFMFVFPFWKKWIKSVIPYIKGKRILEVSFGSGYLMKKYAKNYEAYGVDYNLKMVSKTRKKLAGIVNPVRIIQGNVEKLPYPDNFFDTVINTMAFTGYPDGERALAEMLRVLRPGGLLLVVDFDYPEDRNILGYYLVKIMESGGDIIKDIKSILIKNNIKYDCLIRGGCGSVKQ